MRKLRSSAGQLSRAAKGLLLSIVLLVLSSFPALPARAAQDSGPGFVAFTDLGGALWAEPAIGLLSEQGAVHGLSAGTFAPNAPLTAEAAVTLLWHLFVPAGTSAGGSSLPGVDSWAQAAVSWAISQGVLLHPDQFGGIAQAPAPREQVVAWVVRTLGLTGGSAPTFNDAAEIPPEYAPAVGIAQSDGIVSGDPDGNFDPLDPVTRAQMAVLLVNAERAAALASAQSTPISWQPAQGGSQSGQTSPLSGTARLGNTTLGGSSVEGGVVSLSNATISLKETFLQAGNFGAGSLTMSSNAAQSPGSTGPVPFLWQSSLAGGTIWALETTPGAGSPFTALTYIQGAGGTTNFQMPIPAYTGSAELSGAFRPSIQNGTETVTNYTSDSAEAGQLTGPVLPSAVLTGLEVQIDFYGLYAGLASAQPSQ